MTLKHLVNRYEKQTNDSLRQVCAPYGIQVFVKVRLADVLPIEGSGIADSGYSYAMKSHLDFVAVNAAFYPIFAVEFDGPAHQLAKQRSRDDLKNRLCRRFRLPLLRIDTRYLDRRYNDMDLLSWLTGVVLSRRETREMLAAGGPALEVAGVDPVCCAPFVISLSARRRLGTLSAEGVVDRFPTWVTGADENGNAFGVGGVWLRSDDLAVAEAQLPFQGFPMLAEDLLEELLLIKLVRAADAVLSGQKQASTFSDFQDEIVAFCSKYQCHNSLGVDPKKGQVVRLSVSFPVKQTVHSETASLMLASAET